MCAGLTFTTELHWQLLAGGVSYKLARSFLNVSRGAGRLIIGLTSLTVSCIGIFLVPPPPPPSSSLATDLHQGSVTFLYRLVPRLFDESDGTFLIKRLLADLLPGRFELCDVGVVALLRVLVSALQYRILLQSLNLFVFHNTTHARVRVLCAPAEIHSLGRCECPTS